MKIKSLFILGLLTVCSIVANAAIYHKAEGIWYSLSTSGATATVYGVSAGMTDANAKTITIPNSFKDGDGNTRTVTGFGPEWWLGGRDAGESETTKAVTALVENLNIDVTNFAASLASGSFDELTKLGKVVVTGTNTKDWVINGISPTATNYDYSGLKAKSMKVAENAFYANAIVATVILPAQDTEIGGSAFQGATALEGIDLTNVTKIGDAAFTGCNNAKFTSLTIPASIVKGGIGASAFTDMTSLTTVTITNDNLETIDGGWFVDDNAIKTVTITAANLTSIDGLAFNVAPIETLSITAPKLTTIGAGAFASYAAKKIDLTALTSLTTVADDAFPTSEYTSVKLAGTKLDDTNFANALAWIANSKESLKTFTLPGLITAIPDAALSSYTKLEEIVLTKNIETIGDNAFQGCTALATITIPAKVKTIGGYAFWGCKSLATADLTGAAALETIGVNAFASCTALTTVAIPAKVTTIDNQAFYNCAKLATVDFSAAAELLSIGFYAFAGTALTKIDLGGCAKLEDVDAYSFPENVYTSIKLAGTLLGDDDMDDITDLMDGPEVDGKSTKNSLKEFTFPAAVTEVPDFFFKDFTALTQVSLPKNCVTIGESAFEASGLTAFKIREKVTTIGVSAFKDCAALATLNLGEATALTTIGESAFEGCAALATTNFAGATALKEIGARAFYGSGVAKVSIPANANPTATLAIDQYAFANCAKLTSFAAVSWAGTIAKGMFMNDVKLNGLNVPTGIHAIGEAAFKNCEKLATVNFKYDVKDDAMSHGYIGEEAFYGCSSLAALDLSTTQLTQIGKMPGTTDCDYDTAENIFWGCTSLATIIFPEELKSLGVSNDGMFADCPIVDLDASMVVESGELFGWVKNKKETDLVPRDAKTPNTTLKSVKIRGRVPGGCFAYCTALETVEYFSTPTLFYPGGVIGPERPLSRGVIRSEGPKANDVSAGAFAYCTGLKTFTYKPEEVITVENINYNAFVGCTPYIHFDTNSGYTDNNPKAPLNCAYEGLINTDMTVKTVLSKAGGTEGVGKFYNALLDVNFKASDCKIYTAYVDDETIYYQAGRTVDGYYNIPKNTPVIVKTTKPAEISFKEKFAPGTTKPSTSSWNDVYCSVEGDDLVAVQTKSGLEKGQYLYRFTNTADYGFAFTLFTGSTVKAGQFFVASAKKPASGRLNEVWLDEDGNVEGGATAIQGVKQVLDANDGAIYNLNGVRVQNPTKGIYIQNGRKMVVK